ncbi:MAG: GDSL-like Lipase/Acylhydrolase family protein [Bacteriophage sp.]|nr:MAG: GDSL-like Lipase/Acylhydrolase family protein [Bacteriophage sp.]
MTNPGNLTDEQMQVLAQRIAAMADTPTDAPAKGVRQYVGARYVPVFANPLEWSDTREYEPLTIVTYQGNSYTSMQYVPTNISIADTAYWALTGNFNAQVEAYRAEVRAFDDRINANATAINANATAIKANDAAIKANAAAIAQEKTDRTTNVMLAFGDSYGVDTISQGPVWCEITANNLQATELHNYCVGGATFNTTKEKNFFVQVDKAISEIKNPEYVKYVGIVGGTNDGSNSITDAIVSLVAKINSAFPNAVIGIGLNASKQDILSYGAKQKRIAALNLNGNFDTPVFIDSVVYTQLANNCMMDDNIHPTAKGSNRIGTLMTCVLKGAIGSVVATNEAVNPQIISSNLRTLMPSMIGRRIQYIGSINATPSAMVDLTTIYPDTIKGSTYINDSNVTIVGYITTGSSNYPSLRINSSFTGVGFFGFDSYVV